MAIIPSQNLLVYTDGLDPSMKRLVYDDENISSVYTDRFSDGIYSLSGKMQRRGDVEFFQTILPTEWPRDSNWDSRSMTWHFHQRNVSVGDSIGKSHYIRSPLPTLSSSVSPSSSFPSHVSPPKLQLTTHPNSQLSTILNTSTQVSYTLYVVTISVSCGFYHFL